MVRSALLPVPYRHRFFKMHSDFNHFLPNLHRSRSFRISTTLHNREPSVQALDIIDPIHGYPLVYHPRNNKNFLM